MTGSLWCPEMMNIYSKLPFCRWGNSPSMEEGTYPVSLQLMCKHPSEASCLLGRERGGNEFIEHLLTSAWAMSCTRRFFSFHLHQLWVIGWTGILTVSLRQLRPRWWSDRFPKTIHLGREKVRIGTRACVSPVFLLLPLPHFLFSRQPPGWILLICKIHICCITSRSN